MVHLILDFGHIFVLRHFNVCRFRVYINLETVKRFVPHSYNCVVLNWNSLLLLYLKYLFQEKVQSKITASSVLGLVHLTEKVRFALRVWRKELSGSCQACGNESDKKPTGSGRAHLLNFSVGRGRTNATGNFYNMK